jgi:hypothetical protein
MNGHSSLLLGKIMQNWFKFYGGEYLCDPKMLSLSPAERSCWITLLCYASISDIPGEIKHLTEERLMSVAGLDNTRDEWGETLGVLKKLENLEMIRADNGMITIINYRKRQDYALSSYERVKKHRELKRNDNEMITHDNEVKQNDNTRIEENRIEEKKRKEKRESASTFFSNNEQQEKVVKILSKKASEDDARAEVKKFVEFWIQETDSGLPYWETKPVFNVRYKLKAWLERSKLFANIKADSFSLSVGKYTFKTPQEVTTASEDGRIYWDNKERKWHPTGR